MNDLRYALRLLWKSPAVSIIALPALALVGAVHGALPAVAAGAVEFQNPQRSTTFKIETLDGLVFVPVQLNKAPQRWFVLDTGSSRMLIEKKLARELAIPLDGHRSIGGAGTGRVPIEFVRHVRFEVPGLAMPDVEFAAADLTALEALVGRPIEGIIGYDFFASNVVAVDYETNTLTVTAQDTFAPPADAEKIPMTFDKKWIRVRAVLALPGIATVEDLFLIDSGSKDEADHPAVARASGRVSTNVGQGLGKSARGAVVRANSFRIGTFVLKGTEAATIGNETVGPLVGASVLRRFHVTYDYPGQQIFLRPNRFFAGDEPARSAPQKSTISN